MNEHNSEHGEHGEVHLPDPSVWPLIVGLAALLMGLALVYWTRDRQSNFSGPLLGAGVLGVLIAAFGWAYEDGRMKRKAEAHELTTRRNARFTQVLTFGIAEGRLGAARSGGILSAMETSDSALRDLAGFQDMRIIAAPAEAGPSQVLVETTWSDREGLATYEETRATLLDMVAQHPDDVVPGSVQVFDMEVVRDTKDIGFRFGMGAATAVFASLAVGGLMLGAGLTAFQKESTAAATVTPGGNGGGTDTSVITATDNHFSTNALVAPPNTKVSFTLKNTGKSIHNLHFYDKQGGQTLADGAGSTDTTVPSGTSDTLTFTTPAAGTYYFQCDFHPTEMNGVLTVKEGAPVPGPSGGATTAWLNRSSCWWARANSDGQQVRQDDAQRAQRPCHRQLHERRQDAARPALLRQEGRPDACHRLRRAANRFAGQERDAHVHPTRAGNVLLPVRLTPRPNERCIHRPMTKSPAMFAGLFRGTRRTAIRTRRPPGVR